jgi:hypothetical protein
VRLDNYSQIEFEESSCPVEDVSRFSWVHLNGPRVVFDRKLIVSFLEGGIALMRETERQSEGGGGAIVEPYFESRPK